MKQRRNFKNPEDGSESDSLDELIDGENEFGIPVVMAADDSDPDEDDNYVVDDSDESFDVNLEGSVSGSEENSDTNIDVDTVVSLNMATGAAPNMDTADEKPSSSSATESASLDWEDENDETIRAMIAAIKRERTSPPELKLEDCVAAICFHPEQDIIAVSTVVGDVHLYEYSNVENKLLRSIEIHVKAVRDVQFGYDGRQMLTCSKDKSIMVTDMETEKLLKFYETAHDQAINKLHIIDENLFATGDDEGTVKLWDLRQKAAVFELKEVEEQITQITTNDAQKLLLVTSADGYLTTINLAAKKLYMQSEPYEEELSCMGTFRSDSKLIVGTSMGRLYTYNWGQFGYHSDMFPGMKSSMSCMVPITDRIGCVAGEDGIIRAFHVAPFHNLGIVGQHKMSVESLDINHSGELIASSSHEEDVRFWNVKYFEDFADMKYNVKHDPHKASQHNLPSSKYSNANDFFADLANDAGSDGGGEAI